MYANLLTSVVTIVFLPILAVIVRFINISILSGSYRDWGNGLLVMLCILIAVVVRESWQDITKPRDEEPERRMPYIQRSEITRLLIE